MDAAENHALMKTNRQSRGQTIFEFLFYQFPSMISFPNLQNLVLWYNVKYLEYIL